MRITAQFYEKKKKHLSMQKKVFKEFNECGFYFSRLVLGRVFVKFRTSNYVFECKIFILIIFTYKCSEVLFSFFLTVHNHSITYINLSGCNVCGWRHLSAAGRNSKSKQKQPTLFRTFYCSDIFTTSFIQVAIAFVVQTTRARANGIRTVPLPGRH